MKLRKYFLVCLLIGLYTSIASAQSVNDKVDKNNINDKFLKSLIIERINEIRTYKKAPELQKNDILTQAAKVQAEYNTSILPRLLKLMMILKRQHHHQLILSRITVTKTVVENQVDVQ